jgi:major membrane immunogen (membrane-anchored lipoprotein)
MKKIVVAVASLFLVAGLAFAATWKDGTYSAKETKADERGYSAEIKITVKGGAIAKIDYNESKGGKSSKWADAAYNTNMKKVSGVSWSEAIQSLEASLQKTGTLEGLDAVSGATQSSKRFLALAAEALGKAK